MAQHGEEHAISTPPVPPHTTSAFFIFGLLPKLLAVHMEFREKKRSCD
jgi:hypothetical protein